MSLNRYLTKLAYRKLALAGVSLLSLSAPALADAPATVAQASTDSGDIIVSARRREERLQDVPKVVNAVTSDDLRKNNIQKFEDIATIVPGVVLQNAGNGLEQNASMRGVSFDIGAGLPSPTVQFYLNDANTEPNWVFESMYDIGQIEVLRGPQGTLRGRSAPSGSITITTKLPDLYHVGGFAEATIESGIQGRRETGALNVPLIPGRLAVRVAGDIDENSNNGIANFNPALYPVAPYNRTWSERVSVRVDPIDSIDINLEYQRLTKHELDNLQTESICVIDPTVPCNAQPGPSQVITSGERLSTINGQRQVYELTNIWNGRADWHVLGQKLSWVGQFALSHLGDNEPEDGAGWFNGANTTTPPSSSVYGNGVNYAGTANPFQKVVSTRSQFQVHEVRLASEERIAKIFDYVVGFMTIDTRTASLVTGGEPPQSQITFGSPFENDQTEESYSGNLTAHPTDKFEVSGGFRHILAKSSNPLGKTHVTDTIWSASASYHFNTNVMGYVNAGSSFRPGGTNLGFEFSPYSTPGSYPGGISLPLFTTPTKFYQILPEKSKSYEIGLKSQLLNRRLTLNLDYYHQDFNNYQYITTGYITYRVQNSGDPSAPTLAETGLTPQIAYGTINVPVKVDGVEGDINYRIAHEGNIGADFSYANGRITGGAVVPCIGATTVANPVATCPGGPATFNPRFSASAHGDYARPINASLTGFVRSQVTINGATPFDPQNPYDKQPAYALVNVYAGVRAPTSAWELTFFVKNLFNNSTRLTTYGGNINAQTAGNGQATGGYGPYSTVLSNYVYINTPPPREFGATLHYAFGSR